MTISDLISKIPYHRLKLAALVGILFVAAMFEFIGFVNGFSQELLIGIASFLGILVLVTIQTIDSTEAEINMRKDTLVYNKAALNELVAIRKAIENSQRKEIEKLKRNTKENS